MLKTHLTTNFFFYSGDTNGFLDAVRARVEAGGGELGMEKAKHLLKKYEALPRPKKPAEMRIETLEKLMKDPSRKKDVINISAVIKAYEDEQIKYLPGYFYLFVNGKFRSGPLPNDRMKAALGETSRIGRWVEMANIS